MFSSTWSKTNQTINLSCSDSGVGCNYTTYCTYPAGGELCSPDDVYSSYLTVGCSQGQTCEKRIRYRSNDSLGNLESVNSSKVVRIDKQPPRVEIDNPTGGIKSGVISLRTSITDEGSGVDQAKYQVLNASNYSQEFASGSLSGVYDTTWNSSQNISQNATVFFNVSANDSLGNLNHSVNVTFVVDNQKPAVSVRYPDEIYLNSDFTLNITAESTSGLNLSQASYNISNSSGLVISNSNSSIKDTNYTFRDQITINELIDGKYNLSAQANNSEESYGQDKSWFALDRDPPESDDDTNSTEPWYGKDRTVNLNCSDPILPDGTKGSGCAQTLHCINSSPSCSPNQTETSFIVSCSENKVCEKQVVYQSNDTLGNLESIKLSNLIKIDKQAPKTEDNATTDWVASNQTVNLSASDEGSNVDNTFYCIDTTGFCTPDIICSPFVKVGCPQGKVCRKYLNYKSEDKVGNEEDKESVKLKIDKQAPTSSDNLSEAPDLVSENKTVEISCDDGQGRGCGKVRYCVENESCSPEEVEDISSGSTPMELGCVSGQVCELYLGYRSNDSLGNLEGEVRTSNITIDKQGPEVSNYSFDIKPDPNFPEKRIYPGRSLRFRANLSDLSKAERVTSYLSNGYNVTDKRWI